MKILLTGTSGQVGYELERSLQPLGQVVATPRSRMDLSDLDQVRAVMREVRPQLIVNAAGYTTVDQAETEPELVHRINASAPEVMAEEARASGAAMVYISSDYVFDGSKQGAWVETDAANPLNVYGASKLAGEQAVAAAGIPHLIFRTSWVYGMRGENFLLTILRLAREQQELRVVADQLGAPTWSRTVADTCANVLTQAAAGGPAWWDAYSGTYHLSAQGQTTWHGFAEAIVARAGLACKVLPITSDQYPLPAKRPANSCLSGEKLISRFCSMPQWEHALTLCLAK